MTSVEMISAALGGRYAISSMEELGFNLLYVEGVSHCFISRGFSVIVVWFRDTGRFDVFEKTETGQTRAK